MKKLILIALLSSATPLFGQQYSRAKIFADSEGLQKLAEMGISIDHGKRKAETFLISDFSDAEIALIRNEGFQVEILIDDVKAYYVDQNQEKPENETEAEKNTTCNGSGSSSGFVPEVPSNFNLGSMGGFLTYQEFLDEIDAMTAQYPNLISAKAPISTFQTIGGRSIYYLRLSDNPNTDEGDAEPEILYTAVHHAREPNSLSEVIFYMWYLLENYATDPEVKYLVDNTEMYFVPMVNPDGYIYNQTTDPNGGGMWRKNRRNNGGGDYGVDLNRNYSYGWGTTGVSMDPGNDTYPGTGAFSEAETQAIKWFCENRNFVYAFNAHTYGNDILHPIGTTVAEYAVDHDYFEAFTHHMIIYNGYTAMKSSSLYPASGDSDDYMYKVDTVVKPKIFAMTPEVSNTSGGFWPASTQITGICQDMVFPNMILAHLSRIYYVTTDTDPSSVATTTGNFNHSSYRLGIEDGPVTVTITPLQGISSVGTGATHNLAVMGTEAGSISYTLDAGIQFGDVIRYVLNTDNGLWTKHDTIVKTYGALTTQFLDEANAQTNWTGNWGTSTTEYYSPSKSFTDSPTGDYSNNANRTFTFNDPIDLTNVTAAGISFYAKWAIENDFDYCQFQVSVDGGTSWQGQCGNYTNPGIGDDGSVQPDGEPLYDGTQSAWVLEEINLSDYIGETIRVRFLLESDGGVREDGFYFDDFKILYTVDDASLTENATNPAFMVPNPANHTAMVSLQKPAQNVHVKVMDLNGKVVFEKESPELTNTFEFSVANWQEGVYHVYLEGSNAAPMKLVVIH